MTMSLINIIGIRWRLTCSVCLCSFAAYNVETVPTDRHHFNAVVPGRDLWETYLPVFQACAVEAKGAHIMVGTGLCCCCCCCCCVLLT